jgi:elongation factor G
MIELAFSCPPDDQRRILEKVAALAPAANDFQVRLLDGSSFAVMSQSLAAVEALLADLQGQLPANVEIGPPQVAYRETLSKSISVKYTHKKQTGGSGQFAEVTIDFEPLQPGEGFVFENDVVGGAIPKEFIPAVEKGLRAQKESGLLAGFPVIDFKAKLVDGKYHEVDSNALTFDIAARAAFRELASRGAVKLLEPIMKVEVVTPEDFLGGVIGDLNSRRGQVQGTDSRGNAQVVTAMVPLANMLDYVQSLRSISNGRANYSVLFDHYGPVPAR